MFGRRKSTPLDHVLIVITLIACFSVMGYIVNMFNPLPSDKNRDPAELIPVTVEITGFSQPSRSERLRKYDIPTAYVKYELDGKEYNAKIYLRTMDLPDDLKVGDKLDLAIWPDDTDRVVATREMRKARADAANSFTVGIVLTIALIAIVLVMAFILLRKPKPDDESTGTDDIAGIGSTFSR
ncbi:MAG: hypothetical protein II936_04470 [Oscillospiraceae bacterium]|nr:hypothetical protein [Oscillospiraceae bacterium]